MCVPMCVSVCVPMCVSVCVFVCNGSAPGNAIKEAPRAGLPFLLRKIYGGTSIQGEELVLSLTLDFGIWGKVGQYGHAGQSSLFVILAKLRMAKNFYSANRC